MNRVAFLLTVLLIFITSAASAQFFVKDPGLIYDETELPRPPSLSTLQSIEQEKDYDSDDNEGLPFDIRREAVREAAASYGARGGLSWRTYEIRQELKLRARYLDKIFDFGELLIPAPSGLLIEPPIISEVHNAQLIDGRGQEAAISDRIYNILHNAQIVPTPRSWREYLERDWGEVEPPPDLLRPENDEEREVWEELTAKGWELGIKQADEIFEEDLNRLTADFKGMVRFRMLLSQGMVSPPFALLTDRGVTGGGNEMRVGDRAVQITGSPKLVSRTSEWRPANR